MIIFVGGTIGAGKSTIARGLATHFGFPYYDVDEVKKVVYRQDPDFEKNMSEGIPFSDETRREVFRQVCSDLDDLVKSNRTSLLTKRSTNARFAIFCTTRREK